MNIRITIQPSKVLLISSRRQIAQYSISHMYPRYWRRVTKCTTTLPRSLCPTDLPDWFAWTDAAPAPRSSLPLSNYISIFLGQLVIAIMVAWLASYPGLVGDLVG